MTPRAWRGAVAGFDDSDRSRCAVRWAAAQSVRHGCPLYVVCVLEPVVPMMAGWVPVFQDDGQRAYHEQRLLDEIQWCREEFAGLDVHGSLHDGRPGCWLARYADQVDADVVAVGDSGRRRLARLLLGSTSDELARHRDRTVVVFAT